MAKLANVNLNNVETDEREPMTLLDKGLYTVWVDESSVQEGPKGPYIKFRFAVEGAPNKIFKIISLGSNISLSILKALGQACGHPNPNKPNDTEEYHGKRVQGFVDIEKDKGGRFPDKNIIKYFKPLETTKITDDDDIPF